MLISFSDAQKQRFWAKVCKTDECWLWVGPFDKDGYGKFAITGRGWIRAHRASYMINLGEIPNSLCVLHRCDTPACIRHDHLFLGTQADNARDKVQKQRSMIGERNPRSKLTEEAVVEIREKYSTGFYTQGILAKLYRVCPATIQHAVNGRNWRNVKYQRSLSGPLP